MSKVLKWIDLSLVFVVAWLNILHETECQLSLTLSRNSSKVVASRKGRFAYVAITDRSITQANAKAECEKRGGHLCSFANTNEFNNIIQAMPDKHWTYWTGLKYTGEQPSWEFSDGTDPTFALGKLPDNFDPNYGLCIGVEGLNGGRLLQKHCTEKRYYICKIGHGNSSSTRSSDMIPTGRFAYEKAFSRGGRFTYRIVAGRAITQANARAECEKREAHLCSFANTNEFKYIIQAMPDGNWTYWTGLKYTGEQPSWEFSDGTDPNFALGKISDNFDPNNGRCIAMERLNGGRLLQKNCTEKWYYICKSGHGNSPNTRSSDMIPTGSCPSENVGTVDALGVFTWPESRAESLVRLPCPHNRSVYATRECQHIDDGEISWGPIDSKACPYRNKWSQEIFDLSKKRINSSNVVPVSERIRNLSFPGTKLIPDDIVHTATILENIVAVKEKSDQVADDFLGTVDNILDAPLGVVMMSQRRENSSLRIVGSLNTFLEKLNVTKEQPFRRTLRNYAVYLQMVDPRSFSGITFSGVIKSEISTQLRDGGIETKLTDVVTSLNATTIRLPRTLFNDTTVALSQSQTIVFALYKETKFFRLSSHGSMRSPQRLNSYIIAGGIKGLTISNLRNPIVLTYPNLKPGDKNDTVCGFWNFVGANWSTDGCLFQGLLKDGRIVCNCNHLTNFGILMDIFLEESEPRTETDNEVLSLISYVGCGLSLTGLMMTIITILLFKDLRSKLPSQILLNFCIALSLTLIVFLAAAERSKTPSMAFCRAAAIALHYFVLAAFMWMGMEAFNMYLAFVHILPSYFPNFLLKCCIVAWGIPAVLVSITAGVALDQYGDTTYCRLRGVPFLVSYLSPTLLILVANSIAFALIMRSLLTSGNKATDNQKATGLQQARRGAAIMVLLGLTWMFGVLAIKDAKLVFQSLFCIFNSLQGLLVFVFYVVLPDGTRKMYAKFWQRNAGNPKTKREVWSSGTGIPKKADNDKYKEAYGDNIMSISSPHADTLSDNSTNVADSFRNCMVQLMEQRENGNVKEGTVPDNACKTSGTVILNGLNPGR